MTARWILAVSLLGCAASGPPVVEDEAPRVQPVPDARCPERPVDCRLEGPCPPRLGDDARAELDALPIDVAIQSVVAPGATARAWLELHAHERTRGFPDALHRDVTADVAASKARLAAIEVALLREPHESLEAALLVGDAEDLPRVVLEAVPPVEAVASLTRAIACGRRGPDAQWVQALASIDHAAAKDRLRELVRWPAASVQVAALATMRTTTDAHDVAAVRDAVASAWSPWVKYVALGHDPTVRRFVDAGGIDCREGLRFPIRVERGTSAVTLREPARDASLDLDHLPPIITYAGGELVDLREAAHVATFIENEWVFGVHRGELGGGVFARDAFGNTRHIDPDPVVDMLPLGGELIVASGTDHMGAYQGRVSRIVLGDDGRVVRRHRLELPAAPRAMAIDDGGAVIVATAFGIVVIEPDDRVELRDCDGRSR